MTWRSISKKKTQARSNLRKRRSHCLVTHFGLRHAQKSTTFKAPIHCYIKHMHIRMFHLKVYYPTTNHTTSTTLIRRISTEKNGKQKKNTPVTTLQATRSGLGSLPRKPCGAWTWATFCCNRGIQGHVSATKPLPRCANIKHPKFTLRVVGNLIV